MSVDFKSIRNWSREKVASRITQLSAYLAVSDNASNVLYLDELIVIFLEILRSVIEEKKLSSSPFDLFIPAYGSLKHPVATRIIERFFETQNLVERFKKGTDSERDQLKPQLIARGML